MHRAAGLARTPGRRDDPCSDERPELCGAVRCHRRRCHVIDDQSNIAMVEAGLGISIMPQMLLRDCKAAVKVYPIEPEEYRVVGLAVQRPASMAPAVEQMFHHIVDYCRQLELPL